MTNNAGFSEDTTFECSNGGVIKAIGEDHSELERFGDDGVFAYFDDLHLDAYNDMVVDVRDDYHVSGSVRHVTGDEVMRFHLSSMEPNGKVDMKLSGLQPDAWYRVRFNGSLAKCAGGRAHGQTNEHGILDFNEVVIPNG